MAIHCNFCALKVSIGYKRPKRYILTPQRKHIGKAIARGSWKAVAEQCFRNPARRKYLLDRIALEMRKDLRTVSSMKNPSCLRYNSPEDLKSFTWNKLLHELSVNAPTLLSVLQAATRKRIPRKNAKGVICICAAIILKHHNSSLSLVQKIVALILFGGHASTQVSKCVIAFRSECYLLH